MTYQENYQDHRDSINISETALNKEYVASTNAIKPNSFALPSAPVATLALAGAERRLRRMAGRAICPSRIGYTLGLASI